MNTTTGQTLKCPICGKPYQFHAFSAADQTACPECVAEAERAVQRESNWEERQRRRDYFGGGR